MSQQITGVSWRIVSLQRFVRFAMLDMIYLPGWQDDNPRMRQDHPIIGTVGRISNNIDVALLLELADCFPTSSIINIGTVTKQAALIEVKTKYSSYASNAV